MLTLQNRPPDGANIRRGSESGKGCKGKPLGNGRVNSPGERMRSGSQIKTGGGVIDNVRGSIHSIIYSRGRAKSEAKRGENPALPSFFHPLL